MKSHGKHNTSRPIERRNSLPPSLYWLMPWAILVLSLTFVYWKLLLPGSPYVWFDHYDMCMLQIPRLQFLAREIHNGGFPLWDPHIWSGQPVLGQAQPGPLYPLNLIFIFTAALSGSFSVGLLNLLYIAVHLTAAVFMYIFCRSVSLGPVPSILGAIIYSCQGFLGVVPWIDIANGAYWAPIIWLSFSGLCRGPNPLRSSALLGIALGLSWLSGHHEIPLLNTYCLVVAVVFTILFELFNRRQLPWRLITHFLCAATLAVAISAAQLLPLLEFGRLATRWVSAPKPITWNELIPYSVHAEHSLSLAQFKSLVVPQPPRPDLHLNGFFGSTTLALAGIGALAFRKNAVVRIALALGGGALLFALGANTPFHRLVYDYLPLMEKARHPIRAIAILGFSVSVLAAYGSHWILQYPIGDQTRDNNRRYFISILILITCHISIVTIGSNYLFHTIFVITTMATVGVLMRFGLAVPLACAAALTTPILAEAAYLSDHRIVRLGKKKSVCAQELTGTRELAEDLVKERKLGRIAIEPGSILTNLGDLYGLDQLQGFVAAVPSNLLRHEFHTIRTQQLFGVTHHLGRSEIPGATLVKHYPSGIKLFRIGNALPEVWLTHRSIFVENEATLKLTIQNPNLDLSKVAVLLGEQGPKSLACNNDFDDVHVVKKTANTIHLVVRTLCPGLLVIGQTFYPGWVATVNEQPRGLREAYGVFPSVPLDAGTSDVIVQFRPVSVRIGLATSVIGLFFTILIFCRTARKVDATERLISAPNIRR